MMSPSQWITLFVILYAHLLAPTLPGPLESFLKNPLVKILGVFWLIYQRTRKWKFSLLLASGLIAIMEGSCWAMYGREAFCNLNKHRWCPSKDVCYDETKKRERVLTFLDDTDNFIKSLYNYLDINSPDTVENTQK